MAELPVRLKEQRVCRRTRNLWQRLGGRTLLVGVALVVLAAFLVPYDIWWRAVAGPYRLDKFGLETYTGCADSNSEVRLAVVMPLAARDTERALEHIRLWTETAALTPCELEEGEPVQSPTVDLYFYYDRPLDADEHVRASVQRVREALQAAPRGPQRCFHTIGFLSAELTADETRNTYRHNWVTLQVATRGTVTQFYRLMLDMPHVTQAYTHVFYMEPDARPVQAHWLAALQRHADPAVWMKGSPMRYPKPTVLGLEPYRSAYLYHINGNALYRVGCPCFEAFLRAVRAAYRDYAFDTSIAFYRLEYRHYALFQRTAHRFAYTDVVADCCDYPLSQCYTDGAYVVHGKHQLASFDWKKLGRY